LNGLSGANDWVNFGTPAIFDFTIEDFSVEMWVAVEGGQGSNNFDLFGKGGSSWGIGYEYNNGDSHRFNVKLCGNSGCGTAQEAPVNSGAPFGTFKHVAFTKSTPFGAGNPVKLYVDGVDVASGGGLQPIFSVPDILVAAGRGGGRFFNGSIDEIRVHDVYLSSNEVFTSFNDGPSTNLVSPIAVSSNVVVSAFCTEIISEEKVEYRLESATDLVAGNWVADAVTTEGTGTNLFLYTVDDAGTNTSYRVAAE
jgi:hypothetical protein